jgi:Glutamate-cysteine ligase
MCNDRSGVFHMLRTHTHIVGILTTLMASLAATTALSHSTDAHTPAPARRLSFLQVTFQGRDIDESRFMYDQLAILSPIMLALSAATPILHGRLVDTDVRWAVIAASVDDRTAAERGEPGTAGAAPDATMAGGGVTRLLKSRYDSISTFLHYCKRRRDNPMYVLEHYNDVDCRIDAQAYETLTRNGVDPALATHIAHLFTRDPLVIFEHGVSEVDDEEQTDHFENIQSTNWQTVRWKPPPPRTSADEPQIGWRWAAGAMRAVCVGLCALSCPSAARICGRALWSGRGMHAACASCVRDSAYRC